MCYNILCTLNEYGNNFFFCFFFWWITCSITRAAIDTDTNNKIKSIVIGEYPNSGKIRVSL